EVGLDEVVAGHDKHNTRCSLGRRKVKLADPSMGVRRAQHVSACLAVQVVVALEPAVAAQERRVLETPHRSPDSELAHYLTRSPWWQGTTCSGGLLQSRDTVTGVMLVLLNCAAVVA